MMHPLTMAAITQLQINAATFATIARVDRARYEWAISGRYWTTAKSALDDWRISSRVSYQFARDARALLFEWMGE